MDNINLDDLKEKIKEHAEKEKEGMTGDEKTEGSEEQTETHEGGEGEKKEEEEIVQN